MKPTRLLLADVHEIVLEGVRSVLAAARPEWEICARAGNGFEAVAQAAALKPDIAILESELPQLDGLAVAAEIMKCARSVRVLFFSGTDSPYLLREMHHSRAHGCVLKSEPPSVLIAAIESLLEGHRFRSRGITERCEQIDGGRASLARLTRREHEILRQIALGHSNKIIAEELGLSIKTVETHRSNMGRKLALYTVAEQMHYAYSHGLVQIQRPAGPAA